MRTSPTCACLHAEHPPRRHGSFRCKLCLPQLWVCLSISSRRTPPSRPTTILSINLDRSTLTTKVRSAARPPLCRRHANFRREHFPPRGLSFRRQPVLRLQSSPHPGVGRSCP